ncbi:MAG TPA: PaaI family thioesterase [Flavobacteriia bacterium]|nr:PaaI family thioesterase [Flavobacteriia bacterium]
MLNTHLQINETLNGEVVQLKEGYAKVVLETNEQMGADSKGLVHGGFIFSAADYATMVAVNDPNVVLSKTEVKFLAPTKVGQIVELEASISEQNGNRVTVEVLGKCEDKNIFKGTFYTVILEKHVLEL